MPQLDNAYSTYTAARPIVEVAEPSRIPQPPPLVARNRSTKDSHMTHSHNPHSTSHALPAAVRSAVDQAQALSDSTEEHTVRSWEAARHVGDLSALAMVALARR
jgi:hypothetical protein